MQGHKSSVSTLPENLSFDHGSGSSEPVIDSQISWNNVHMSPHNQLRDYRISPNEANLPRNAEWSVGETSSTATQSLGEINEIKREDAWSTLSLDDRCLQALDILPRDNYIDLNEDITPQADPEHGTGQVMENHSDLPCDSSSEEHVMGSRLLPCKRKSLELHAGQSSGSAGNNGPEQANLLFSSARSENSRRNRRLRINGSHQPLNPTLPEDPSSGALSTVSLGDHLSDVTENVSRHDQSAPLLHATFSRRNILLRWAGHSSQGSLVSSGERNHVPRSTSEHPMFAPGNETGGSSSQQPGNWNWGSNSIGSSSGRAPGSVIVNSPGPSSGRPPNSRRLSEIVRRSLLTSGQAIRPSPSQGVEISTGPSSDGQQTAGRTSLMSEQIRHVLDLMRRGEGLRFEDMMLLDRPLFFGMADIHDRHRDMRLDIDNMSYEELLALEEQIGNVSTGLNDNTLTTRLKQTIYVKRTEQQTKTGTEPCSICREEYVEGEDLGTLDCGHEFHRDCIKQWLMHKNLCPICKTTGLVN